MNQENAPHMQPMEQAGTQAEAPLPQNASQTDAAAAAPQAQPAQASMPPYGYAQAQPTPYPAQNMQGQPYPNMPYGAPYGSYPQQAGYAMQPMAYQPAVPAGYPVQAFPGSTPGAPDGVPAAPQGEVAGQNQAATWQMAQMQFQPQQAFPQQMSINQQAPNAAQAAGVQQMAPQPYAPEQAMAAAQQHEQPFVPSFVEAASYDKSFAHTMNGGIIEEASEGPAEPSFDYHYINSPARIAIYDSLKTAPRVIQVQGGPTHEYIEHIASLTYQNAKDAGGMIPYTVIREVSENFIHAKFNEVVVSIFDQGNTIRFADQGPGIKHKDLVQKPGFSSAIEPMKRYIRGVGSGLPIVKDYLSTSHGHIEIKDNVNQGSVVTISLVASRTTDEEIEALQVPDLTENEAAVLKALLPNNTLGVSEVSKATNIAVASVHTAFSKMEEAGLVEKVNKKRTLTSRGTQVALSL